MIYVDRGAVEPPSILNSIGTRELQKEIREVLNLPNADRMTRRIHFRFDIYRHSEVKSTLAKLFCSKCAFCEVFLENLSDMGVEHFRPKASAKSGRKTDLHHYSWLAYDWNNLYPICQSCNNFKKDKFPVQGHRGRLGLHIDELRVNENAILVDPCFEQPQKFIRFDWLGKAVGKNKRGRTTVDIYGLNRENLVLRRRKKIDRFIYLFLSYIDVEESNKASELVEIICRESEKESEFSAAILSCCLDIVEWICSTSNTRKPSLQETYSKLWPLLENLSRDEVEELRKYLLEKKERLIDSTVDSMVTKNSEMTEKPSIKKIQITKFKGIESLSIEIIKSNQALGDVSDSMVFIGDNGVGKSSILEAVTLAIIGPTEANKLISDPSGCIRISNSDVATHVDGKQAEIVVSFYGGLKDAKLWIDRENNRFEGEGPNNVLLLAYGCRRFFSPKIGIRKKGRLKVSTLFDPLAVIPDPTQWLLKIPEELFEAAVRVLREIIPDGNDLQNIVIRDRKKKKVFFVQNGVNIPLEKLSDGYKSIIALTIDIAKEFLRHFRTAEAGNGFGILVIDEVEAHLHPSWKIRIVKALRSAVPDLQLVASTHDPLCLRGFDTREIFILERHNDEVLVAESPGKIGAMRTEQILTSSYFGLRTSADIEIELSLSREAVKGSETKVLEENSIGKENFIQDMTYGDSLHDQITYKALSEYLNEHDSDFATIRKPSERRKVISRIKETLDKHYTRKK